MVMGWMVPDLVATSNLMILQHVATMDLTTLPLVTMDWVFGAVGWGNCLGWLQEVQTAVSATEVVH